MSDQGLIGLEIIATTPEYTMIPVATAYLVLGMRFRAGGEGPACPIDRGDFEEHGRVVSEEMQYEGSIAATMLAELGACEPSAQVGRGTGSGEQAIAICNVGHVRRVCFAFRHL